MRFKAGNLAQSHKAAKRSASVGGPIEARQRENKTPSSLRDFVALFEPNLLGSTPPRGSAYADAVSALRAVAMLCDPVVLGNRR
ncbi:hypothetical protein [Sphingomonas sp. CARO-RG-8B-R24-01]|uniref:hypothetical protein n=1 Tax=Sphingomonas sp. CARO-RG-8B-R24-01 TaxID=2914831 RepID=UPI001F5ADAC4|nr:hypothetical protein [Sphingomonas sp. CARO-RG-8B-R24-01]